MNKDDIKPGDLIYANGHVILITAEWSPLYIALKPHDDDAYHIDTIPTKESMKHDLRCDELASYTFKYGKVIGNIKDLVKLIEGET